MNLFHSHHPRCVNLNEKPISPYPPSPPFLVLNIQKLEDEKHSETLPERMWIRDILHSMNARVVSILVYRAELKAIRGITNGFIKAIWKVTTKMSALCWIKKKKKIDPPKFPMLIGAAKLHVKAAPNNQYPRFIDYSKTCCLANGTVADGPW